MRGLSSDSLQFIDRMGLRGHQRLRDISRGVVILGLQPEVSISPYLREYVESLSSALFRARARRQTRRFGGERVAAIHQKPDFVFIKFVSASDAQHFLDNFPAATLGAKLKLMNTKPLHNYLRLAIKSGAGRALTMSLPIPMSLSVEELTRDFSQFRGLVQVTMSTDHEVILRYNSVLAALKTVCALDTGTHRLPDKYVGGRVSFLPMRSAPPTRPITILENYEQAERRKQVLRFIALVNARSAQPSPPPRSPPGSQP
ncbi:hypothetical protein BDZ89DRAFT_678988 [Hymenopellis radicata]|nr:hypothetical protein BDZ89DRAFT_678988 [Hymenopellis radicata]